MENHSFSYLNNCQVQLDLFDMGADGIIARNYDFDGKINEPSFKFNYCFYQPIYDGKLSYLKNYDWVEVLRIDSDVEIDDISPLIDMTNLKEIICPFDIFSDSQKKLLTDKHKDLKFTLNENAIFDSN